jgi:hypothetical protein
MTDKPISLDPDGALKCPECGEITDMHHGAVSVHSRTRGDDSDVVVTDVGNGGVRLSLLPAGTETHGRRSALLIKFSCDCGHASVLRIMQHKGMTFVGWV